MNEVVATLASPLRGCLGHTHIANHFDSVDTDRAADYVATVAVDVHTSGCRFRVPDQLDGVYSTTLLLLDSLCLPCKTQCDIQSTAAAVHYRHGPVP